MHTTATAPFIHTRSRALRKAGCQWTNLATVRSAPTQRDELAGRQSVRERCVGVQADSARVITPQRPSDHTCPPWTPVRMAADPSAPVTCLIAARAPTSAPLPLLPVPVTCLESGSTTLPSARQRASILGSWAVADKATALGVSESGTLPARACAVGADSSSPGGGRLAEASPFTWARVHSLARLIRRSLGSTRSSGEVREVLTVSLQSGYFQSAVGPPAAGSAAPVQDFAVRLGGTEPAVASDTAEEVPVFGVSAM